MLRYYNDPPANGSLHPTLVLLTYSSVTFDHRRINNLTADSDLLSLYIDH